MRLKLIFVITILSIITSCSDNPEKFKILVIGDVQLKGTLEAYSKDKWNGQSMDTVQFTKLFSTVLAKEKPDFIFQTGDWVNYNDNFSLQILDTLGNVIETVPLPYSEWEYMNSQIPKGLDEKFFIAFGNHESYSNVLVQGVYHPDYDILGNITTSIEITDSNNGKESILSKFPHLKQATFNNSTASYYLTNNHFSLLSIDGLDKDRYQLLKFIEEKLKSHESNHPKKPIFVISHYPIFTGLSSDQDSNLVYHDIRSKLIELFDQYNVDFFFNGHEHFYLRYSRDAIRQHFPPPYPDKTEYLTISDFANPYSRELKRIKLDSSAFEVNYFKGTHYVTIEMENEMFDCKTYGYSDNKWKVIDEFLQAIR